MMAYASFVDRRAFLKWVGALPLFGYIAAQDLVDKAWGAVGKGSKDNIYTRIGVKPLINARGVWTYLSGTLELPAVRAAKEQAAMHFVDIFELNRAVGKRLAEIAGAEAGMVTSGAAGAMSAATAACIAGTDSAKVWQLPDTTGLKSEVIIFGGRSVFDSAIRLAGGKLVVARTFDELQAAINGNTAMVYMGASRERLEKALAITKKANVPLLADDAAGIPPFDNFGLYAKMGCDLYTFSGGKGLRGPQCSGVLLGRKDLIEAALANYSPWEGSVCRPLKVGKEEIMGVLAAVEWWSKADINALDKEWRAHLGRIAKLVETVPGVKAEITKPEQPYVHPKLKVSWDEQAWGFTIADCDKKLREGEPRIEVLTWYNNPCVVPAARSGDDGAKRPSRPDEMQIIAQTLQPGEELIIGRRLREILSVRRKGAKTT
jgi:seryl-tRNA(Sec) selenium transferase